MKKHLGKGLLFWLLALRILHAESFVYDMHLAKEHAYLHEPILLSIDINQTDPKPVLLFQFEVEKSPAYHIEQIDAKHDNTLHHSKMHNLYLLYPLKTGKIAIHFKLTKRVTNEAKVSYFFSGDRDDFKKLETTDTPVILRPLILEVKPLPQTNMLVGDFNLSYEIPTQQVDAYTPIPMTVTLQGEGYPPKINNLMTIEGNVSIFQQKPLVSKTIIKHSIAYTVTYTFAFSAAESFHTPEIVLPAFNPKTNTSYTLSMPKHYFEVHAINKASLVDKEDNPKPLSSPFSKLKQGLLYLWIFLMGYLSAYAFKWQKKRKTKSIHPLKEKISQCKDEKSLFQLLIAQDDQRFASCIQKLEAFLYGDAKISFKEVQHKAMEKIE